MTIPHRNLPETPSTSCKEVLSNHCDILVMRIREAFPDMVALVLYGGYGRGEGSWIREQDVCRPYNDYDLLLVANQQYNPEKIKQLRRELAEELAIHWIDISVVTPDSLSGMKPSIANYDIKYASVVLDGDPHILDRIPEMQASNLPLVEAFILFRTRLWTFLGSLPEGGLAATLEGEKVRFFRNQMAKAVLASVDCRLLLDGLYHWSYRERAERMINLSDIDSEEKELVRWAIEEKLEPKAPSMTPEDLQALYDQVHQVFSRRTAQALSRHFGKSISDAKDVEKIWFRSPPILLRRVVLPLIGRGKRFGSMQKVFRAQILLYSAYTPGGMVNRGMVDEAVRLMREVDSSIGELEWVEACSVAARLRMEAA